MGRDKAWVELDGKPLVVRVMDALKQVCDEIIIVTNEGYKYEQFDARLTADIFPNTGSLGGIYSGLHAAQNNFAVAVACDMPFLNVELLKYLISSAPEADVVIPSVRDEHKAVKKNLDGHAQTAKDLHLHPLHAVYNKNCLTPIADAVQRGDLRMISFHDAVRVRVIPEIEINKFDSKHISFWNVNTAEELIRAESFLQETRS
jgi:molybdopterin-guanine dinucleotide biosynthesis protein A